MSKFDAVIDILKVELSWAETRGWCPDKNKINQLCSAIRVLEAAGKITDKAQCKYFLEMADMWGNPEGDLWQGHDWIDELVESLPDPATEKDEKEKA